jgi:imidazolonepropionase
MPDLAVVNAGELVTCAGGNGAEDLLGVVEQGAMIVEDGKVAWLGTTSDYRRKSVGKPSVVVDARGGLVTPGFVDPHTHLLFAGSREDELERKVSGESYKSILSAGGGIMRTVSETRKASLRTLVDESKRRASELVRNGVTTIEAKTGYGQRLKDELKMIEASRALGETGAEVVTTFLGLHSVPPEFRESKEYTDYAVRTMLPEVARMKGRPPFSDCFCEEGVFSPRECSRYLRASAALGFELKVHADEFADSGGAELAARLGCTSADHLGRSSRTGVREMSKKGVVAVLLPGTSLFSSIPYADAKMIKEEGCTIALGTDLSPNSWIESPQLVMSLACNALKMTPAEAILGFTRSAARAISREDVGYLGTGSAADFVVSSLPGYRFLPYRVGGSYVREVFKSGRRIFTSGGS